MLRPKKASININKIINIIVLISKLKLWDGKLKDFLGKLDALGVKFFKR